MGAGLRVAQAKVPASRDPMPSTPAGPAPHRVGGRGRARPPAGVGGGIRAGWKAAAQTAHRLAAMRPGPRWGPDRRRRRPGWGRKGTQPFERLQSGMHRLYPPAHPAQHPRQLDVRAQPLAGRLQARCLLHRAHHRLHLAQGARETRRQTVRQQTEGLMPRPAVPAGNPGTGRGDRGVGAMAGETATPLGVRRTAWQACLLPGLLGNGLCAGQRTRITAVAPATGPHGGDRGGPSAVLRSPYSARPMPPPPGGGVQGKPRTNSRPLCLTDTTSPPVAQCQPKGAVNCGLA